MSTEHKRDMIRDIPDGEMLKDKLPEGDMIVSEGPKGNALWKKKKKLNEDESEAIHFIPEVFLVHTRCPKCGSPDFEITTGRGVSIASIKGER